MNLNDLCNGVMLRCYQGKLMHAMCLFASSVIPLFSFIREVYTFYLEEISILFKSTCSYEFQVAWYLPVTC